MPDSTQPTNPLTVHAVSRTHVGMRRRNNQDAVTVCPGGQGGQDTFLMVADGMGAHAAGELASKMAVDSVPHAYLKANGEPASGALRNAIRDTNRLIHEKGASSPEFLGMGTTCSCLAITQGVALVGHVGDSRVYRLRDRVFEQLTFDHSLVWEMAAASKVSEDKVPACIPKNVITRSLGPHESVMVDLEGPHALQDGDTFMICSDGLTGVVEDPLAGSILATMGPDEAADTLVNLANLRGGPDNISVIVARVQSTDETPVRPEQSSVPPREVWWAGAAAVVCLVACLVFSIASSQVGLLVSAIGLGAAIAYALSQQTPASTSTDSDEPKSLDGSYGNGPYRRTECGDHSAAAGDLRDLVRELSALRSDDDTVKPDQSTIDCDALLTASTPSESDGAAIDWEPLVGDHKAADEAFENKQYATAIRGYAGIISRVMQTVQEEDRTAVRVAGKDSVR